jgi:hypothetical protein
MSTHSFFAALGRLAGTGQQENQLSRTFAACFEESAHFRRQVLRLLWDACRKSGPAPEPEGWICTPEISTPVKGGGRVDLRIARVLKSGQQGKQWPAFTLESKVESPLTDAQVRKYRSHGVEHLVAITKYRPEVSQQRLRRLGAHALRWQDVHRALRSNAAGSSVERRVATWMADYLEELGMAYREQLTVGSLRSCGRLFRAIACSKKYKEMDPRDAFEVAHGCLGLLDDLYRDLVELHPKLAARRHWGTSYYKWRDPDGNTYHFLGWCITKSKWTKWRFGCDFGWPENDEEDITFSIYLYGSNTDESDKDIPLQKLASTAGVLDPHKLLQKLNLYAGRWNVV